MNYLKYIEHSAENLQFHLWYQDYCARFSKLPLSERGLATPWLKTRAESYGKGNSPQRTPKDLDPKIAEVLNSSEFADPRSKAMAERNDPFDTPDKTPSLEEKRDALSDYGSSTGDEKTMASSTVHTAMAENAFEDAGLKWKPCKYA